MDDRPYFEAANHYRSRRYGSAFRTYLPLAQAGDGAAQLIIGWMYQKGRGTAKDLEKAREWYQRALHTEKRDEAAFRIGVLFERCGDHAGARESYKEASAVNFLPALYRLALLESRSDTDEDGRTVALLKVASDGGHLFARASLIRRSLTRRYGVFSLAESIRGVISWPLEFLKVAWRDPYDPRIQKW